MQSSKRLKIQLLILKKHHQLFDFVIVSLKERYKASNCGFCPWRWWTWQSKLPTAKRKTNRTVSSHFSHWASKPLSRGSYCGCVGPTHKYCTGSLLDLLSCLLAVKNVPYLFHDGLFTCCQMDVNPGSSPRSNIFQKDWTDRASWWSFFCEWQCESSSWSQCKLQITSFSRRCQISIICNVKPEQLPEVCLKALFL